MGNLEKVLIVIILATIAVITALAFLDSGDDTNLRDERSSGAGRAASAFDRAVREAEDRARADAESSDDETENAAGDDESELESFFRERSESNDGSPTDEEADPTATREAGRTATSTDPEATAADNGAANTPESGAPLERSDETRRDGPGTVTERPTSRTTSETPPGLSIDTKREAEREAERRSESQLKSLREDRGYVLGSRRYTSAEGDTWAIVADIVYGDADLAWAVREANTDVRSEPLPAGVALFIVPHEEIDRSRAPSRDDSGSGSSEIRIHLVKKDETLSGIARQYYGSEARWKNIFEANRDQLATERDLRPGMKIRIP